MSHQRFEDTVDVGIETGALVEMNQMEKLKNQVQHLLSLRGW